MARLRGTSWQADVFAYGRRHRPAFKTQAEAEAWEAAATLAVERKQPLPSHSSITKGYRFGSFVDEAVPVLWGGTPSERHAMSYAKLITEYFGKDRDITTINTKAVAEWVDTMKRAGNSGGTINRKLSHLSKLLKHAKKRDYITSLPEFERGKEGEGRIRFLSQDEETTLFTLLARWGLDAEAAFLTFLLYTGCRPSEAARLEWRDVSDKRVTFWHTKTKRPRSIPLTAKAKSAVNYGVTRGWDRPWSGVSYHSIQKIWDKAKLAMRLDKDTQFVIYCLRHTCASRLVQAGIDIRRVKEWMGHSTITMTMRYAHLSPTDLDVAAEALDQAS